MTEYLNCENESCKKEWIAYNGDDDHKAYMNGEDSRLILTHCECGECHNIFYKTMSGNTCSDCGIDMCNECAVEKMEYNDDKIDYICLKCKKD